MVSITCIVLPIIIDFNLFISHYSTLPYPTAVTGDGLDDSFGFHSEDIMVEMVVDEGKLKDLLKYGRDQNPSRKPQRSISEFVREFE